MWYEMPSRFSMTNVKSSTFCILTDSFDGDTSLVMNMRFSLLVVTLHGGSVSG